ncbi:hypothetical protein Godav_013590, partial [Gossypium davidsonii]|nr:hypothetical protein [Gossypium davidsonii]
MDDLTDPAPGRTFAHLNATTVLSKGLAAKGIYPAVDPLESTSTMLQPRIIGKEQYETTQRRTNWRITKSHAYCHNCRYRYFENTPLRLMVNNGSDGGFARIGNNKITILVNDVEKGSDIDPQ